MFLSISKKLGDLTFGITLVIVVCYDWVLTHIVSAITFAEPKKVDVVFSVLPVCCILRCLGEVIFLCVIL